MLFSAACLRHEPADERQNKVSATAASSIPHLVSVPGEQRRLKLVSFPPDRQGGSEPHGGFLGRVVAACEALWEVRARSNVGRCGWLPL
jgi:hypothetical protein